MGKLVRSASENTGAGCGGSGGFGRRVDFSSGHFIAVVYEFADAVASNDDSYAAGKVGEADFQFVVVVNAGVNVGEGGNEAVVDSVVGGGHP